MRLSDPIRSIGFTRSTQKILLKKIYDNAESGHVIRELALQNKKISSTLWCDMWKGDTFPGPRNKTKLSNYFPDQYSSWLYDDIYKNRLQRHLAAIDIEDSSNKLDSGAAIKQAWKILIAIHDEWRPDKFNRLNIPELVNIEKQLITETVSTEKLKSNHKASSDCSDMYNCIDPSSVIPFMMYYGLETELPIPELRESFVLDILSAAIAVRRIILHLTNGYLNNIGISGLLSMQIPRFILLEDYDSNCTQSIPDDPIDIMEWYIEKIKTDFDILDKNEYLSKLRKTYFTIYKKLNIPEDPVMKIVSQLH